MYYVDVFVTSSLLQINTLLPSCLPLCFVQNITCRTPLVRRLFPIMVQRIESVQYPRSLAVFFFYHYSFLRHVFSYRPSITPPQFLYACLSVSTHFHLRVGITTYYSVFLPKWPNHLSIASVIFSLVFATHTLALMSSFLIFSIHFCRTLFLIFVATFHIRLLLGDSRHLRGHRSH